MKRNKLIYMIVFSLVFLGFTSGVNAANVNCCYKTSDNIYTYASMPEGVCNTYSDHSTNLTQSECANKNIGCCYKSGNTWQYTTNNLTCNQNNQNFNVFSTNLKYLKLLT